MTVTKFRAGIVNPDISLCISPYFPQYQGAGNLMQIKYHYFLRCQICGLPFPSSQVPLTSKTCRLSIRMPIMAGIIHQYYDWHNNPERECLPLVTSNLQFICPLKLYVTQKPFIHRCSVDPVKDTQQLNVVHETKEVLIRDIRGWESSFSLECNGFEVLKHQTRLSRVDFASKGAMRDIYIKETEALLKERFRALSVIVFGCVVS
jgi:hypothetical protein